MANGNLVNILELACYCAKCISGYAAFREECGVAKAEERNATSSQNQHRENRRVRESVKSFARV